MPPCDYRTRWSGIRRRDLVNAMPFTKARMEILSLIKGKVVVGHAIHNDFKVIGYCHPPELTRDTSRIPLLNQMAGIEGNKCTSLKTLTKAIFNRDIQTGNKGHSSVEDARATMELYKVVEHEWETQLAANSTAIDSVQDYKSSFNCSSYILCQGFTLCSNGAHATWGQSCLCWNIIM
uniref:Exonuclease domain-containing protein n=1 Tax=Astatotilapia calliptera TaxID=8154 RepID=A0A3P8NJ53_ASTCA